MHGAKIMAVVTGFLAFVPAAVVAPDSVLGVPPSVLLAACAGALFGLAYTPPERWGTLLKIPEGTAWKRRAWVVLRAGGLVFTLVANAFACSWATQAVPHVPLLTFTAGIPAAALAGLLAFGSQHIIPRALQAAVRKLDRS